MNKFGKYNLIDTEDKLKELDAYLMDADGNPKFEVLAYDTETNGLDLYRSCVVGFSLSVNSDQGFYIPLLKWESDPESEKTRSIKKVKYQVRERGRLKCIWTGAYFEEFVTPQEYDIKNRVPLIPLLLERWLRKSKLLMHNAPFDVNMTYICMGVDLGECLLADTALLAHVLNENEKIALKRLAELYKTELGINPHANAAQEQKELIESIYKNGGKKKGEVWRAELYYQSKYACADTFLTYGLFEVMINKLSDELGAKGFVWFFEEEVMPVCKEVVIPMHRTGIYIDVEHFKKLEVENDIFLKKLEDEIIENIKPFLDGFQNVVAANTKISEGKILKKIIQLEGLESPKLFDKKTQTYKDSLSKKAVKDAYQQNPHWVWGYILGEDELRYPDDKLESIKNELFEEQCGRRHLFNINSRDHLIWLFCDKLGFDKKKLPQTDSSTSEKPSPKMDAEVLTQFLLPKFEWVAKILKYKKISKLQSTYIKPAVELNFQNRLFMDMKQAGTKSGRFSCSGGYNLQTLPKVDDEFEALSECENCASSNVEVSQEISCIANLNCKDCNHVKMDVIRPSVIKRGFIAPPGYKIVNSDYSSLEPRCFAAVSGESKIKEVYWKGLDFYCKVYCDVYDPTQKYSADPNAENFLKKVAKTKRNFIKPIVLAIPYGAEAAQVAKLIGAVKPKLVNGKVELGLDGKPLTVPDVKEGAKVLDLYLNTYPALKHYMETQEETAVLRGYVETLIGRRRHLPYAKKINDFLLEHHIDWKDLIKAKYKDLKDKDQTNYVSERGYKVNLTKEMLRALESKLGFKIGHVKDWKYIKGLLKEDLNNAKNSPIQGLAAHFANRSMLETARKNRENNIDATIILQVHDEITEYAKEEEAETAKNLLKVGMENHLYTKKIDVPMIAEPIICDNLMESK